MREIWKAIQRLFDTIERVRTIAEVVGVVAVIGIVIRQWVRSIDTLQLILVLVAITCIGVICATYIVEWRRRRSIRYIPKLLSQMRDRMEHLIETAGIPEQDKMEGFFKDLGEILNVDIEQLKEIANLSDEVQGKNVLDGVISQVTESMQSQPNDLITSLLIPLASTMNFYGIGLASIKDREYNTLEEQLATLKHRIRKADTMRNLNNYILWSNGLNSLLLLSHYNSVKPISWEMVSAKGKAFVNYLNPIIEMATSNLLAQVTENILGNNENDYTTSTMSKLNPL